MSYEKQTWANGDVITADRLNHIEDGVYSNSQSGGVLIVTGTTSDGVVTFSETRETLNNAYASGKLVCAKVDIYWLVMTDEDYFEYSFVSWIDRPYRYSVHYCEIEYNEETEQWEQIGDFSGNNLVQVVYPCSSDTTPEIITHVSPMFTLTNEICQAYLQYGLGILQGYSGVVPGGEYGQVYQYAYGHMDPSDVNNSYLVFTMTYLDGADVKIHVLKWTTAGITVTTKTLS